ncbi:MAG TPA: tetratricopeptide repeat protein [Asticcacaulis sp.]|nr:tetratricopeptide repeat protein [Asticcacaulis sp.]
MSDLFDETEENLRADKWLAIVKTALPWVSGGLAALLIGGLAVYGWGEWQKHVGDSASEAYEAAMETAPKGDKAATKAKFEAVIKAGSPGYKALALMQLGGIALDDNDSKTALKDFDEAAKASSDVRLQDLAAYKAALLAMDSEPYADLEKRLTPLTKDGRPYAALAKEALAMAKLQNGDAKGARSDLQVLSLTLGTPDGVKARAQDTIAAIDSGAFDAAKASLKLPEAKAPAQMPGMGMMPGGLPQGEPQPQ